MSSAGSKTANTAPSNAFAGKLKPPTAQELVNALGPTKALWESVLTNLAEELQLTHHEWGSSSAKLGWSLRVKEGDRIVVYLAPWRGGFCARFVLGDKAVRSALAGGLPEDIAACIRNGKSYAEGTPVSVDVRAAKDVLVVAKLAAAKLGR